MATELNVDVLRGMGFDVPAEAGPNDLVVALRTDTEDGVWSRAGGRRRRPRRRCAATGGLAAVATTRSRPAPSARPQPVGRHARRHLGARASTP